MTLQVRDNLLLKFIIKNHTCQYYRQTHTEHCDNRHADIQLSFHIISIFSAGHLTFPRPFFCILLPVHPHRF